MICRNRVLNSGSSSVRSDTITDQGLYTAIFTRLCTTESCRQAWRTSPDHTTAPPLHAASHAYQTALENISHTTGLATYTAKRTTKHQS